MQPNTTIVRRATGSMPASPLHHNALIARLLASRGVLSPSELEFSLRDIPTPELLPDIKIAIERLGVALVNRHRILIIGDYDCDGATSTSLAILALSSMGAKNVDYLVPNRFEFGYGLSPEIVDVAAAQKPDLIVTVDNGVASVEGVERASALGIEVIVTDHHLPPAILPKALAIVNPNLDNCQFPARSLAGVGVIFYVMLALRAHLKELGWFRGNAIPIPNLAELLDLVAIGTVADVVPLDSLNRTLIEQGLRRIRAGRSRPGVNALIKAAGRHATTLCATDIGFALGPRLNAAGRLDDIRTGIECLLSESEAQAMTIAQELNALNQERRSIEAQMQAEADVLVEQILASLQLDKQNLMSLCLSEPHWHQGVIGILAGRLKETLHVPVVIFASSDDHTIKGSGRSIPGLHIRDALDSVATSTSGLIQKFGGHAMAAGLSIAASSFEEFRQAFDQEIRKQLNGIPPARQWETDGELIADEFSLENAQALRFISPWGQDFPEPVFDGLFTVNNSRILKERHLKLSVSPLVSPVGGEQSFDAIAFNQSVQLDPGQQIRLVYRLAVNEYRSKESLQLTVQYLETEI